MKTAFRLFVCAAMTAFPAMGAAQNPTPSISSTRNDVTPTNVAPTLERGRVLLSINDARALPVLREVASRALSDFQNNPTFERKDAAVAACFWHGKAAQVFNARDEAIEAWAQGMATTRAFAAANLSSKSNQTPDETALRVSLDAILLNGLPLRATLPTLQTLSETAQNAWKPAPFTFKIPNVSAPIEYSKVTPTKAAPAKLPDATSHQFLITNGVINLPIARMPSLYASLDAATLPSALKMNRCVVGYARQGDAWQQKVRVLYSFVDDAEQLRAEKTSAQFLRVQSLYNSFLGQLNRYASDGVTTVWLTRQSAEWPQVAPAENWNAGAWIDSSPDQMLLFRSAEARPEAEWLREIAHEYAHIALPPFAGFVTPLEPFGNGRMGETLTMLWAASSPQSFFDTDEIVEAQRNCKVHVARYAIPALAVWLKTDPTKPLSALGDENAINQLLALAVETERVYGADVLRRALDDTSPNGYAKWRESAIEYSMRRNAKVKPNVLRASDLLRSVQNVMRNAPQQSPIWLSGALQHKSASGKIIALLPEELARRAPLVLKAGESASGWIWIPANATTLRVFVGGKGAAIQIEGDWKVTKSPGELMISTSRKTGWQKLTLRATSDATLNGAQFECKTS